MSNHYRTKIKNKFVPDKHCNKWMPSEKYKWSEGQSDVVVMQEIVFSFLMKLCCHKNGHQYIRLWPLRNQCDCHGQHADFIFPD